MPDMHKSIEIVLKTKKTAGTNHGIRPIPLDAVADIKSDGPPINSENAMLRGSVLFNVRDRDLGVR
jgi:Cu/Ag efflux pump CusA